MYGKSKGLLGIEELLYSIEEVKNVSAFNSFSLVRDYLMGDDADMIFLDADNEMTDWRYLVHRLREINHQMKIVLLSSNPGQSVRAYEAGVFDYLLKPVKKKQMERVISKELITP